MCAHYVNVSAGLGAATDADTVWVDLRVENEKFSQTDEVSAAASLITTQLYFIQINATHKERNVVGM